MSKEQKSKNFGMLPACIAEFLFCWNFFVLTVQFEGSLGKLTVSSVNNPRKMIDAVVTSRSEDDVSVCRIVYLRMSWLSPVPLRSLE